MLLVAIEETAAALLLALLCASTAPCEVAMGEGPFAGTFSSASLLEDCNGSK
jgi:hypothetical protein